MLISLYHMQYFNLPFVAVVCFEHGQGIIDSEQRLRACTRQQKPSDDQTKITFLKRLLMQEGDLASDFSVLTNGLLVRRSQLSTLEWHLG